MGLNYGGRSTFRWSAARQLPLGSSERLSGLATGGRLGIADGGLRPIGMQKPPLCMVPNGHCTCLTAGRRGCCAAAGRTSMRSASVATDVLSMASVSITARSPITLAISIIQGARRIGPGPAGNAAKGWIVSAIRLLDGGRTRLPAGATVLFRKSEQQPAGVIGPILAADHRRAGEQKTKRQLCRPLRTLCLVRPPQDPQRRLRRRLDTGASLGNLLDVAHERLLSHGRAARGRARAAARQNLSHRPAHTSPHPQRWSGSAYGGRYPAE